ncbi:response regulator [Pseudomarimonas arenosa]|uniref:Response regulator n=1 Tax=Pseudomarimonas arenosa TaxID=2774145 RepID=A0AAW3ZPI7_9GAMM|nr:response regulator [Pseudomarimonas arenosa]MBD8528031.1 response regulator [Pseudomarimonas arenosa]
MHASRFRWPVDPQQTRVLVVEDDSDHQLLLRSFLNVMDHGNVVAVRDADSALRELDSHRPALAFLDIRLPGKTSGLQLLETLSQRPGRPFVVMMTSDSTLPNVQQARQLGASHFIAKPFNGKKVHETLERFYGCACPMLG